MATAEKPFDDLKKHPEGPEGVPEARAAEEPEIVCIGFRAWLRSIRAIAASVFRHPYSTTHVDLSTGEAVQVAD